MNVLILCYGNRYRSPLCMALLRHMTTFNIESRGFRRSGLRVAKPIREYTRDQFGLNLDDYRSIQITHDDLLWADHVVYMDGGNKKRLEAMALSPNSFGVTRPYNFHQYCLGAFANPPVTRIPDPAFVPSKSKEFLGIMKLIETASRNFAVYLKRWDEGGYK